MSREGGNNDTHVYLDMNVHEEDLQYGLVVVVGDFAAQSIFWATEKYGQGNAEQYRPISNMPKVT